VEVERPRKATRLRTVFSMSSSFVFVVTLVKIFCVKGKEVSNGLVGALSGPKQQYLLIEGNKMPTSLEPRTHWRLAVRSSYTHKPVYSQTSIVLGVPRPHVPNKR
jgi:hypothetical protein